MTTHDELARLCRRLGEPQRDLAVLGEGNASARLDDATLLVTTSGSQLGVLTVDDLVEVALRPAAALASEPAVPGGFDRVRLTALVTGPEGAGPRVPSIETLLHALLLERTGAAYVGHTHPTSVLGLACGDRFEEAFASPIFPDEVVVCGPAYLLVPYAPPGPALAAALDAGLTRHRDQVGEWPRAVVLANHGLLALGASPAEVMAVTTMADKSARARATALAVGRLRPLPPEEVAALSGRADEHHRRRRLVEGSA